MDGLIATGLKALLDTERVLSVAVAVDGRPVAALLPFVPSGDYTRVFVQASALARHSKGLGQGATIGVLVHQADALERDPMQLQRLMVEATVAVVPRGSTEFDAAAGRLLERFPAMQMTLALGDFSVFALVLGRGRYVEGFARAANVDASTFASLAGA